MHGCGRRYCCRCRGCASVRVEKEKFSRTAMYELRQALDLFRLDNGRYPSEEEGLAALLNSGQGRPPYVKALPSDPWGQPYRYRMVESRPIIDSAGPDRRFDTTDDVPLSTGH